VQQCFDSIGFETVFKSRARQFAADERHDAAVGIGALHDQFVAEDTVRKGRINGKPSANALLFCLRFWYSRKMDTACS
jgi:hypothetical protein